MHGLQDFLPISDKLKWARTSLVVQWLRIHLPMQGTPVWSPAQEDSMCRGAIKPVCHSYWSLCTPEPGLINKRKLSPSNKDPDNKKKINKYTVFSKNLNGPVRKLNSCICMHPGFPGGPVGKEPACQRRRHKRRGFDPGVGEISWKKAWQPTPVFLPREFHGQRSLMGYSPWGWKESDTTEAP